ncbi:MAG: hypothetical protein V9G12_17620 [Microthrixaceae bacterium]
MTAIPNSADAGMSPNPGFTVRAMAPSSENASTQSSAAASKAAAKSPVADPSPVSVILVPRTPLAAQS